MAFLHSLVLEINPLRGSSSDDIVNRRNDVSQGSEDGVKTVRNVHNFVKIYVITIENDLEPIIPSFVSL